MIELYHSPISTCSQKVRLCLAEKKLEFTHRVIDFSMMEQLSDEYLAINPNGVVPTLVHDGKVIVDSSVICEYIDETWTEPALSPEDAYGRAQMRAWMRYFEEVPTTAIRVPSFNKLFARSLAAMPEEAFDTMTERMPLRKAFYRQLNGEDGFDEKLYQDSIGRLEATLVRVENALQQSKWICSDQFGIADIVLVPTIVRMDDIGLGTLWDNKPRVANWFDRVQERASFDVAYYEGSRIDSESFELGLKLNAGQ